MTDYDYRLVAFGMILTIFTAYKDERLDGTYERYIRLKAAAGIAFRGKSADESEQDQRMV